MSKDELVLYPRTVESYSSVGTIKNGPGPQFEERLRVALSKPGIQVAAQMIITDTNNNTVDVVNLLRAYETEVQVHGQFVTFENDRDAHAFRGTLNKNLGCSMEYKIETETDPALGYEFWQGWSQFTNRVATLIPKEVKDEDHSQLQSDSEQIDPTN